MKTNISLLNNAAAKASAVMLTASLIAGSALVGCDDTTRVSSNGKPVESQKTVSSVPEEAFPISDVTKEEPSKEESDAIAEAVDPLAEYQRDMVAKHNDRAGVLFVSGLAGGALSAAFGKEVSEWSLMKMASVLHYFGDTPYRNSVSPAYDALAKALKEREAAEETYKRLIERQKVASKLFENEKRFKELMRKTLQATSEIDQLTKQQSQTYMAIMNGNMNATGPKPADIEAAMTKGYRSLVDSVEEASRLAPEVFGDEPTLLGKVQASLKPFLDNTLVTSQNPVSEQFALAKKGAGSVVTALKQRAYSSARLSGYIDGGVEKSNIRLQDARKAADEAQERANVAAQKLKGLLATKLGSFQNSTRTFAVSAKNGNGLKSIAKNMRIVGISLGTGAIIASVYEAKTAALYALTDEDGKPMLRPISEDDCCVEPASSN